MREDEIHEMVIKTYTEICRASKIF